MSTFTIDELDREEIEFLPPRVVMCASNPCWNPCWTPCHQPIHIYVNVRIGCFLGAQAYVG
jgi:hypothetical protein